MSNQETSKSIIEFIKYYFKTRRTQFKKTEVLNYIELLKLGVLNKLDGNSDLLELNSNSIELNKVLLEISENKLGRSLPIDISEAFKFANSFEKHLQKEFDCERVINSFSHVIKGLKGYVLLKLHNENGLSIKDFLFSIQDEEKRENHLFSFERFFFRFLPSSDYSNKEIILICTELWKNERKKHDVITFLRDFGSQNIKRAKELLDYSSKNSIPTYFISDLLIGLYNAGDKNALKKAVAFMSSDKRIGIGILGRIKFKSEVDVEQAFNCITPLDFKNIDIARQQSYLINSIIETDITPIEIKEKCFKCYVDFINKGTSEIIELVYYDVYTLKDNETRKYDLLHLYLSKTANFKVIKDFFDYFNDPKYVFDIMMRLFNTKPDFRFSIDLFQNGIRHAWQTNPIETERLMLDLFRNQSVFGTLGVKVLFSSFQGIYFIDLLKLEKEEFQITAIKSICKFPHSFDILLPLLLPLRNSKFKNIKQILQKELAKKVFNSYHNAIYELIEMSVEKSRKDKLFLKPIKKALDDYHKMKKLKESIKDLDPVENEKDLMDLYYRLEREESAKMMDEVKKGKGTFMGMLKPVVVVRGNSIKYNQKDPVRMAKIESRMLIDGNSYKNPDLYEHNLNEL